jgi:hypothetical protein
MRDHPVFAVFKGTVPSVERMFHAAQRHLTALAAALAAVFAMAATADGATTAQRLTATTANVPGWNEMFLGGGIYMFNRPGGYYLGRIFDGEQFLATDEHVSVPQLGGGRQKYFWGRAAAMPGVCMWLGPRATSTSANSFVTPSGTEPAPDCASHDSARSQLAIAPSPDRPNDSRFGEDFNCPEGAVGGPQPTKVLPGEPRQFYYNVQWRRTGDRYVAGGGLPNPGGQITVKAGETVKYRFASGGMAVVYHPIHGWGFIERAAIAPATGRWGFEAPDWELRCDQQPATIALGGAVPGSLIETEFINGPQGAVPLGGDWDNSGAASAGYFSEGAFHLRNENSPGAADHQVVFGRATDRPITGDWNGDGADSPGVFRDGQFELTDKTSNGKASAVDTLALGAAGDIPVAGDWDGDGIDTAGVFSSGRFTLADVNAPGTGSTSFLFGRPGDIPVAGDWDGDGIDTVGVKRGGVFVLAATNVEHADLIIFALDASGGQAVAGDWNGDGVDTVGVAG